MTSQLLPDDILALILEEHLTAGTGYNGGERLQTIKSVSLSSRTLALACRRLIFERTKVAVGGCPPRAPDAGLESPVEGLKELFEINPSYFGFVNSLRIEATLVCRLVEGIARSDAGTNSDINNQHGADRSNIVSIHYTSTTSEEAAICWLLSQRFPNLKFFHFIVHLADTSEQTTLRKAAFAKTLPSLVLAADANLPGAVVRFLGAGNESLQHLTLSSNLPPPILRHFDGSKLKSLTLTKFSEVKPVNKSQTEIPFFLGLDHNAKLPPCPDVRSVEVESLSCDMSGGNLLHWLYGPQTAVEIRALKTLHLNPANEGRPFSFGPCSTSLTDLDIVYSSRSLVHLPDVPRCDELIARADRMTPPVSLGSLVALRRVTIRVEAQWSLDQSPSH
jgi:hypothetical protein